MRPSRWFAIVTLIVALPLGAQDAPPRFDPAQYTRRVEDIRMRDGVTLHTEMLVPAGATMPLPILFRRTPYGVADATPQMLMAGMKELAEEGYIFVMQDIRGRYRSQGGFVMQRPLRAAGSTDIDESTDAWDTIDWLVKHVPNNNGRVGMFGVSYDGWTAAMAMLDPHPALRAVSEQASPADMFLGDDFHHNGAFRLSYGFEYAYLTEATKENSEYRFTPADTYEWYLKVGPLRNIQANILRDTVLPTWRDFAQHPNYDAFWKRQSMHRSLTRVTVPTLHVAGWWDQEDFYGPVTIYRTLEQRDSLSRNTLVVGPWIHGSWSRGTGQALDSIDFGTPTATYFRQEIQAPFFAWWLKDHGKSPVKEALVFESGSNTWKAYDAWPAPGATTRSLYFQPGGRLTFTPPTARGNAADRFVSDPADPVPYRRRPIEATYASTGSRWYTWLLQDQRFIADRKDVLHWTTAPLTEDVVLAGDITARLFVSTTGQDADWVVKLIDVYPDTPATPAKVRGYELMVANDVFRSRFRESFEEPKPLVPNTVTPITVDLHTQAYRFLRGHRIMVQVQSSWFPIIDRNPQTWVPNIFEATEADFRAQTHAVHRSAAAPSRIEIQTVRP
ncbi:MAG: CocE/NonD family hydrolase [Gemmatimonadaceae bacterium]|nr:CocE/NonD family hydrolase [Gemmatimonadaceae bacterium]